MLVEQLQMSNDFTRGKLTEREREQRRVSSPVKPEETEIYIA